MRVVLVSSGFPPRIGGVESYVSYLSRALALRGHDVAVLTPCGGEESAVCGVDQRHAEAGVRVVRLASMPTGLSQQHINSHYTRFAPTLASQLKKENADIIDAHSYPALHTDIAFRVSRTHGVPCIIHIHGLHHIHRLHQFALGWHELRGVDGIIVNNLVQRRLVTSNGAPTDRVHVVPPGIDFKRFAKARREEREGKRILFMGRLVESKGLGVLVDAAESVVRRYPKVEFRVVGRDQGYGEATRWRAKRRGISENFSFTGPKRGEDVVDEYARCSLLALPSRHEGFGMVVLESLASGRPAAITDFEGSHWFNDSGICAISRRGDPTQLADNINRILGDERLARNMGQKAAKFAKTFDWTEIARRHEEIYLHTTAKHRVKNR